MTKKRRFVIIALLVFALPLSLAYGGNLNLGQTATGGLPGMPALCDHGGPDAGGYYFVDSQDGSAGAPTYNWLEISGIGTDMNLTADDTTTGPFNFSWQFKYYGATYTSFNACSNGWMSFSSTNDQWTNTAIPDPSEPNNTLAVFWDDLLPNTSSHAYYYTNGFDTLIVEWVNFTRYSGSGSYTFEAIITADGKIKYQYQTMTGVLDSHTIGIENEDGTVGLQYVFNTLKDETGTAILFSNGAHRILELYADASDGNFSDSLLIYPDIARVDRADVRNQNVTMALLMRFDAVIVWSDYQFFDATALGNTLADYIDAGGAVILPQFCFYAGFSLQGRITDYAPFAPGNTIGSRSLGDFDSGHPIMAGISSISDIWTLDVTLANSPILVASYSDGTPYVAYNATKKLVAINGYVGLNHNYTGNVIAMVHNSINFAIDGTPQLLIIAADASGVTLAKHELQQFSDITGIHIYNASQATPSLTLLATYDCVDVWSNSQFDDPTTLGNRLADYIDVGGAVVLHQFCFGTGYELQGRAMTSYSPFGAGTIHYQARTLGVHDPTSPLMAGVDNVSDFFASSVTTQNGAVTVASWDDSTPFVAYNPTNHLVAINGYIGNSRQFSGDMPTLTHNAINFARGATGINDDQPIMPSKLQLSQNYPNPFNPSTTIAFDLPSKSDVALEVYNILGQRVATLSQGTLQAGHHEVVFDASHLTSGVYFYKLAAGETVKSKKMIVLK